MSRYPLLTGLLLFAFFARAQPGTYIRYSTANGLVSNTLYDMVQDKEGFLWFSSISGIYRFDGTFFRHFTIEDGLPDNEILWLFTDSYGRIWFFCFNGQVGYYQDGYFRTAANDTVLAGMKLKNIPVTFYEGRDNQLHILDQNGNHIRLKINAAGISGISAEHDPASAYWENGNDQYRFRDRYIYRNGKRIDSVGPQMISKGWQYSLVKGSALYYSGSRGLYIFKQDRFRLLLPRGDLNFPTVKFYIDSEDELYTYGVNEGVTRWASVNRSFRKTDSFPDPVNAGKVLVDRRRGVWISTLTQGLYYYPAKNRSWRSIPAQPAWPGKIITEMQFDEQQQLIVGFDNGNAAMLNKDFVLKKHWDLAGRKMYMPVRNILTSIAGKIVLSGYGTWSINMLASVNRKIEAAGLKDIEAAGGAVYFVSMTDVGYFDPASGKRYLLATERDNGKKTRKYAVLPIAGTTRVWYSNIEGLQLLENGKKVPFPGRQHPFLKERIIDIKTIGERSLVLISDGAGIALANEDGSVLQVLSAHELHRGVVRKALVGDGRLWLSGTAGIGIFKFKHNRLEEEYWLDKNNGLLSDDVYACCADRDYLYVSSSEGLQKLDRVSLSAGTGKPRLFIHQLVSGKSVWKKFDQDIILPATTKAIRLDCSALAFGNTAKVIFAYRFGSSGSFIESTEPVFSIPIGFEGREKLFLKCKKGDSDWSAASVLTLEMPVPLHKRIEVVVPFFISAVLLAIGLTVYFANRLKRRQMSVKDLKLQVALLEIRALQSSMNPHFVFNALNAIQHFVNEGDAYQVNKYLTKFSRLLRSNLTNSTASQITLEKELAYLVNYLELEQLRFGKRLQYTISVAKEIRPAHTLIPAMLVQPLVENAILHGILGIDYPGKIDIAVTKTEGKLQIRICDNGAGLRTAEETVGQHQSLGIKTIRDRLALLSEIHKEHYTFSLTGNAGSGNDKGATAILVLPLIPG